MTLLKLSAEGSKRTKYKIISIKDGCKCMRLLAYPRA